MQQLSALATDPVGVLGLSTQYMVRGSKMHPGHTYLYILGIRLADGEYLMSSLVVKAT